MRGAALATGGPNSGMPVRYDQARCCTELASKNKIWQYLEPGFTPAADFEVPRTEVSQHADTLRSQIQKRAELREPVEIQEVAPTGKTIVINHWAAMIHWPHPSVKARKSP